MTPIEVGYVVEVFVVKAPFGYDVEVDGQPLKLNVGWGVVRALGWLS